jgi:hypothetical protein
MQDIQLILSVALMFFLRIGIPVLLLITLGTIIDRWQTARENDIRRRYGSDNSQRNVS